MGTKIYMFLFIVCLNVFYVSWFLTRQPKLTSFTKGIGFSLNTNETLLSESEIQCSKKVQQLRKEIGGLRYLWEKEKEELKMELFPLYRVEQVAAAIKEVSRALKGEAKRATVRLQSALQTLEDVKRAVEGAAGGVKEAVGGMEYAAVGEKGAEGAEVDAGALEQGTETVNRPFLDESNYSALQPLRDLVTVLLEWGPHPIGPLRDVVGALKKAYGDIQVMLSAEGRRGSWAARRALRHMQGASVIQSHHESGSDGPGLTWNLLARQVATPLTLLLRDVAKFSAADAALSRLVRVLALLPQVDVVGGAYRNATGHWRFGCHQTTVRNGHLHYVEGYHYSAEDCAYCDHVSGPFIVRTSVLKSVPFSQTLPSHVLFEDWFLRIKERDAQAMVCPDSMFLTHSHATDVALRPLSSPARSAWLPLARAHGLSSVHVPPRVRARYSCSEVGIGCHPWHYFRQYPVPTCCFKHFAQSLDFLGEYIDMDYELAYGSQLGAVKMTSYLPWDLDMDIICSRNTHQYIWEIRQHLKAYDIEVTKSITRLRWITPGVYIELFSIKEENSPNATMTLIQMLGRWLPAQRNPGNYSRNEYGPNYLKHARPAYGRNLGQAHPKEKKQKSTRERLDQFPKDGSVHFTPLYFSNLDFDWENEF